MNRLLTLALFVMANVCLSAQIELQKKVSSNLSVLPAKFTCDNKDYLVNGSDENICAPTSSSITLYVYNDDIEKIHSVTIPIETLQGMNTIYEHSYYYVLDSCFQYVMKADSTVMNQQSNKFDDIEVALAWLEHKRWIPDYTETKGDTTYLYRQKDCINFEKFSYSYPIIFYKYANDGSLFEVLCAYSSRFDMDNWEKSSESMVDYNIGYSCLEYNALGGNIYLTQTLFNTDDSYEYIKPTFEAVEETEESESKKIVHTNFYLTGFRIMSETGTSLASFSFETKGNTCEFHLVELNEKKYLCANMDGYNYYYKIDSQSSSIKQVGSPVKASVKPTIAGRNETITVELADDAPSVESVTVTDSSGRIVYRTQIAAGQKRASIDASRLSNGLNVVSINEKNKKSTNCKVFVK